MNSFYPEGALKGGKKFETLLAQRDEKPAMIYLVSSFPGVRDRADFYKLSLCSTTKIDKHGPWHWNVINEDGGGTLTFKVNPMTGYIESAFSRGYVFANFWHAYAYVLHLRQSNFSIDCSFLQAIG